MKATEILKVKKRTKFSYLAVSFVFVLFLAGTMFPASAAGLEASREISAGTVYAGGTFTVTVNILTDQNVEALTLDENLPDGWAISTIKSDGAIFQSTETFKQSTQEWIWVDGLQAGGKKNVEYRVTVPSVIEPGNFTLSGNISGYSFSAVPIAGASELIVAYPPPEANFFANPVSGAAPLKVQFTDLSTGNPDSWKWDFDGNGIIDSPEKNPTWTYQTTGTYTVSLEAVNAIYGNDTESKTGYITVTEEITSSGGGGGGGGSGGGGGGSPESTKNVELKEISNEQVFKGIHTRYTFKGETNEIVTIEFDPKKNFGKTTTIVEMLKNTSTIVKEPVSGTVYKNLNIWVGNSGFSSPENFENSRIIFRVSRTWLSKNGISENTITLYRHSDNTWNALPTTLTGEDKDYFYFTAETPGFSPFAIASPEKGNQSLEIIPVIDKGNNLTGAGEASEENPASAEEKVKKSAPGPGVLFTTAGLLTSYAAQKKRRIK